MELSQNAAACLSEWYGRKPVFALMGEYSAGKSTLLNLLLDGEVLPTKVTATNLPAVWLTYSASSSVEGLRHDGTLESVDMETLGEDVREQYLLLRFGHDAEILKQADIVDTPGISDPKLAKGATLYLANYLDAVLWLSPANQAWRQTEKTVWTAFPDSLRADSLLVLTRADKMRRASDLTKVLKRVRQETKDLFGEVVTLNTPLAAANKAEREAEAWEKSGGKAFYAALEPIIANAGQAQEARAEAMPAVVEEVEAIAAVASEDAGAETSLAEPKREASADDAPVPEAEPVKEVAAEPEAAPDAEPEAVVSVAAPEGTEETPEWLTGELSNCVKSVQNFDQIVSQFEHLRAKLDLQSDLNPTKRFVLKQCLTAGDEPEANVERLLEQAKFELADFDKDSWCVISRGAK